MTDEEKQAIIANAKEYFRTKIEPAHEAKTKECGKLSAFNVNPFLSKYLAQFAFGDSSPESVAKALILPRVFGTSITTIFGTRMQQFCNDVLSSYASTAQGMDIEYIDASDQRRKYCQVKAGPNTINKDDVDSILNHFKSLRNLSVTNGQRIPQEDCILGVLYGDYDSLNPFYKEIESEGYPVLSGKEFWQHLSGDENLYDDLIDALGDVAGEMNCADLLDDTIHKLAQEISSLDDDSPLRFLK